MAATVQLINDRLLREAVAGKVATRLGMPLSDFWSLLGKSNKPRLSRRPGPAPPSSPSRPPSPSARLRSLPLAIRTSAAGFPPSPGAPISWKWKEPSLLVKILDSEVSLDEPSSLAAFAAGLDAPSQALLGALLRERLPEDRLAAARDCWHAIEKRDLLHRRDVLLARMRDPNLSHGEVTEIQKQILDLQKHLTDISRPLSPSGLDE
jgi:hypothetical protein